MSIILLVQKSQSECTKIALISYKDDLGYALSFNLRDDERLIHDGGETELADLKAARKGARAGARETSVSDWSIPNAAFRIARMLVLFLPNRNQIPRPPFAVECREGGITSQPGWEADMLADKAAMATIAVKDIDAAKSFYGRVLGLKKFREMDGDVAVYGSGNSTMVIYKSDFAGTNKATSATWGVGDEFESIVKNLKDESVTFEHYDMPGLSRQGDTYVSGDFKAAWFKDPDGNILHINNQ
jgi:extradiol dioxygenase family protein